MAILAFLGLTAISSSDDEESFDFRIFLLIIAFLFIVASTGGSGFDLATEYEIMSNNSTSTAGNSIVRAARGIAGL